MRALIVGSDRFQARNVLSATRALGAAGWRVGIGSPTRGLAAHSRWTRRWHPIPSPAQDFDHFVDATAEAIKAGGYEVIFAAGDAEVLALTAAREHFAASIPYPDASVVLTALDKLSFQPIAVKAGIPPPLTRPATPVTLGEIDGPVMVKARLHWKPGADHAPDRLSAMRVRSRRAAERRASQISAAGGEAVLQDIVEGKHTAYIALVDERHEVVVAHQQDGYGTWPPPDGVWTRSQIVRLDRQLHEKCAGFLRDLGWTGLVQLQFLVAADDLPRLIDLNGRFYASIGLAVKAGVNLPAMWASMATGRPLSRSAVATVGMRYQWLEGDLLRALRERRNGVIADVVDCLRFGHGAVPSLWRREDPRPAAAWVGNAVLRAAGRVRRPRP